VSKGVRGSGARQIYSALAGDLLCDVRWYRIARGRFSGTER
jgi:hypothetical protein